MADGIGCECFAICEGECACSNVDWTPSSEIALRNKFDKRGLEIGRLKHDKSLLLNLLDIINQDGGEYTIKHGIEKSCEDAGAQITTWLSTIDSIDALCEQAMLAEREACAVILERREHQLDGLSESCSFAAEVLRDMARMIRARGKK